MQRFVICVTGLVLFGTLVLPLELVSAQSEGAELYARYCALCHGTNGEGYAADNATRLNGQELLRTASDTFLTLAIALGRTETPMAAYLDDLGGPLSEAQIGTLVNFLREWQREPTLALDDARIEGDPERGSLTYSENCASCHGTLAEGSAHAQSLNRWAFLSEASDGFLRHAIERGRSGTPMLAYGEKLEGGSIDDVVAFLRRFETEPDAVPRHLQPPSIDDTTFVQNPDNATPDFDLREGRFVAAAEVADALADRARLVLLDARTTSDWLIRRMPGSVPVPYYDDVAPIVSSLPRDGTWIVAYCGCPHAASGQVIDALRKEGFERTAIIDEGFFHWVDAGYPTESGPLAASVSELDMTTWSLAALDPATGAVGVAMASCVPETFGDAVAALVPGKGVAATQAAWSLDNRNRVYQALREGLDAEAIVERVTAADSDTSRRQYGVVTLRDGAVSIAGFTGDGTSDWAGIASDLDMAATSQGNTLVSQAVVADALSAFVSDDADGYNTLADRLMRGLEAGSAAGGDVRCNRDGITSTAASAMILVARGDDEPYAAADIGVTDQASERAPWLAISHTTPREGPNPVTEIRRRFDEWRRSHP